MNWPLIGRGLRLLYLLRVPLLTLLLLAGFGPVSLSNDLLGNLLDQGGSATHLFLVSFTAFLLAFTAVTSLNLFLYYGKLRFEGRFELQLSQKRPVLVFLSGCMAASILDLCVYLRTIPFGWSNLPPLALGALAAMLCVSAAKMTQLALTDPATTPHPPPYLVFPAYLVGPMEHIFDDIYCTSSHTSKTIKSVFGRITQWPLQILRPAGQGYLIDCEPPVGQSLKLCSGHVFAITLFIIAFSSYLVIGLRKSSITANPARIPALAFIMLLLIVGCFSLSALTYFFDRYRFPLLWTLILLSTATSFAPQSDHFFRVERSEARLAEPLTAPAYLKNRLSGAKNRLILIATPGGGIQAAAWTGQVLAGLEGRTPKFRESVALISSVSGGSVGAMIYAAGFAGNIEPGQVAPNSLRSALDEVAWGWAVPDLWRMMLPWFRYDRTIDRGWALEKKWAAINNLNDAGSGGTMLSQWADLARTARMPALIFNSMLVESGQPVVFSNTRFPGTSTNQSRIRNFYDLYPGQQGHFDIRVNTAARLSASFPYVAPAARPNFNAPFGPGYHFVDGGYYDNFGINSLTAWLGEALEDKDVVNLLKGAQSSSAADILILQIRHFNSPVPPGPTRVGWEFQIAAPTVALFHMRDFAQAAVARNQIEFFARYYATQHINIWGAHIDYNGTGKCADAPLSWKLDQAQQQCIADTWKTVPDSQRNALRCIDDYLAGNDPATYCDNPAATTN